MAVHAAAAGLIDYPKADLDAALYDLLTSECHDALPVVGVKRRVTLKPFEIATFRIHAKRRTLAEVDLLERES